MDTTRIALVIPAAKKQGLLKPSKENICLTPCLNQANFLLDLLKQSDGYGLSTSQIQARSGLNPNTCKCYLRELVKAGFVEKTKCAQEEAIWYLK